MSWQLKSSKQTLPSAKDDANAICWPRFSLPLYKFGRGHVTCFSMFMRDFATRVVSQFFCHFFDGLYNVTILRDYDE
jgi:hypothetical protein